MQQSLPPTALSETGLPSDEQRAQELDKYYTPSNKSALRLTNRDSALPAQMQLLCWRLSMRRALVSLIDRDTQYYVAESTRTMDFHNPNDFVDEDDGPLALVGTSPILCQQCANLPSTSMKVIPRQAFCVLRLSVRWLEQSRSLLISKSATWLPMPDSLS
jgi:hypothetical protein